MSSACSVAPGSGSSWNRSSRRRRATSERTTSRYLRDGDGDQPALRLVRAGRRPASAGTPRPAPPARRPRPPRSRAPRRTRMPSTCGPSCLSSSSRSLGAGSPVACRSLGDGGRLGHERPDLDPLVAAAPRRGRGPRRGTPPPRAPARRESTSITIQPAIRSLVSANGPSVTGGLPAPSYRTNAPSGDSASALDELAPLAQGVRHVVHEPDVVRDLLGRPLVHRDAALGGALGSARVVLQQQVLRHGGPPRSVAAILAAITPRTEPCADVLDMPPSDDPRQPGGRWASSQSTTSSMTSSRLVSFSISCRPSGQSLT